MLMPVLLTTVPDFAMRITQPLAMSCTTGADFGHEA
jgi:hypothetical protein